MCLAWATTELLFTLIAAVTTGWGTNSAHLQLNNYLVFFFCVLTCSTTLLGGGIFQTVKSCIITIG